MNDPFYATIKLMTGEEVLAEAILSEEAGQEFFILNGAISIEQTNSIDVNRGVATSGLAPKPWPLFSSGDLIIVYKENILTISELDSYGKAFYMKALAAAKVSSPVKKLMETEEHTGYLGKTEDIRAQLERLYNSESEES